jgi:hypothetical protein
MAVVIKNTFLDIPEHKFLSFAEPVGVERRCQSLPRAWKPTCHRLALLKRCDSISSDCSTRSGTSSFSDGACFSDLLPSADVEDPSLNLPEFQANAVSQCCACYPERWSKSESDGVADAVGSRTKLKKQSPIFEPVLKDSPMDAVTSCINLALASCGWVSDIRIEEGSTGKSSTLISAELSSGPHDSARARTYEVVQLAKQSLDAITARLDSICLLSTRIQKEDSGYSLRSSVACIPDDAKDKMCWDMCRSGHCPRRAQCRWYHPQDADVTRVKVSVKCNEHLSGRCGEEHVLSSSTKKHKVSLCELI